MSYLHTFNKGCKTVEGGEVVGEDCIFPFKYFGYAGKLTTYYKCAWEDVQAKKVDKPWCSTKIDEDGFHVENHWGVCENNCPVEGKISCFFCLFLFRRKTWVIILPATNSTNKHS